MKSGSYSLSVPSPLAAFPQISAQRIIRQLEHGQSKPADIRSETENMTDDELTEIENGKTASNIEQLVLPDSKIFKSVTLCSLKDA